MYKCILANNDDEIVILTPIWRNRLTELRQLDALNQLICQGCRQPVRVRAGKHRRWHFAHKHRQNCPFQKVSAALLHARAIIYEWLVSQVGSQAVDVEIFVPEIDLPRPIDIWVNIGEARYACWIIETRLQPGIRQQLQNAFHKLSIPVLILFLADMLHQDQNRPGVVFLTTTEREFSTQTAFDVLENVRSRPVGKSLHYLNADLGQISTLRDTHCIHSPQVYQGVLRVDTLEKITIRLPEAEIVHPGEQERLEQVVNLQVHRQEKISQSRRGLGVVLDRMLPDRKDSSTLEIRQPDVNPLLQKRQLVSQALHPDQLLNHMAVCMFCGKETVDWWYLDRATGKCKCRDCLKNGIS